ncbi:MAG: GTPase ObgE [Eubacteriales bacterium]
MLIDNVKIHVKAGDGGNGCVSFLREKFVSHGGPDGGDGGNGGNIVVRIEEGSNTLLHYKNQRKFVAKSGEGGMGSKFHGKNADDLILTVPPGTVIKDTASGSIIKDMSDCEPFILCRGGRGGWGNQHFATPTRQAPRFAKNGLPGEERDVIFELKMIADVGIIGLPNVGKSTLLSVISAARPKIADYNFTTLSPNLGVVSVGEGRGFVAADIPGLIEGAAEGVGLGHSFLRHIDRCRLFIHVVDVSGINGNNPSEDIKTINNELELYDASLLKRPQIIAANKYDALPDDQSLSEFEKFIKENGYELIYISAATRYNVDKLVYLVSDHLRLLPPITIYEPDYVNEKIIDRDDRSVEIRNENGIYIVEGDWLLKLMGSINMDDRDSLRYFQQVLKKSGVIAALEEKGVTDGDTVSIYNFQFDFIK